MGVNTLKETQCPECGEEFSSIQDLENHFLSEHEEGDPNLKHEKLLTPQKSKYENIRYHCDQEYTHKSKYIAHIKGKHGGVNYACNQCDFKTSHENNMRNHITSIHVPKYACNQCVYYADHKSNLSNHIKSKHEGVNYACDICSYEAVTKGNLKIHIKSIHKGGKYSCNQCDFKASLSYSVILHRKAKHEGVKYPCNECDKQFMHQKSLTGHIRFIHRKNGVTHACNECEYQTKKKDNLRRHIRSKHC